MKECTAKLQKLRKEVLNLIWPLKCLLCGRLLGSKEEIALCQGCRAGIKINTPPFCYRCGKSLDMPLASDAPAFLCRDCRKRKQPYFERAWAVSRYEGAIKESIHKLKYNKRRSIAAELGGMLSEFAQTHLLLNETRIIVPVPLYKLRERERSFNQVELLTRHLGKQTNKDISIKNLQRIRRTAPQSNLSPKERAENVRGAFAVQKSAEFKGKNLLLIDDIFTTGATLNECAKLLKGTGAKRIEVLTLAR